MNSYIQLRRLNKAAQAARGVQPLNDGVDFLLGCAGALFVLVLIVFSR